MINVKKYRIQVCPFFSILKSIKKMHKAKLEPIDVICDKLFVYFVSNCRNLFIIQYQW